ncbi:TIGR03032 family protein [Paenibacillus sp. N1-5-1-14]|uniref:TIGR03032 family protein n=1 Tax=Paenibacillus radicibacter TaxID=2972488 RepID=UPI002158C681|nr:TIGR03032 family protein [Paenibacillus radicibacter]MCR8644670.1 TIGR03032 family protein [Paenibacillus radicibacter]
MMKSDQILLISCPANGGLLYMDHKENIHIIDNHPSNGICYDSDMLVRVMQNEHMMHFQVYHRSGEMQTILGIEIRDVHDVMLRDQILYAVSTGTNEIVTMSPTTGEIIRRLKYPGEDDSWHVNCLGVWDDQIVATAFGDYQHYREYSSNIHNRGFVMNIHHMTKLWEGLNAPHNPKQDEGRYYVCDSYSSQLIVHDVNGTRILPFEGFTRGLCFSKKHIFLGVSYDRHSLEKEGTASIKIMDKQSLTLVKEIPLPCLEIYEMMIVDKKWLRKLYLRATSEK